MFPRQLLLPTALLRHRVGALAEVVGPLRQDARVLVLLVITIAPLATNKEGLRTAVFMMTFLHLNYSAAQQHNNELKKKPLFVYSLHVPALPASVS